MSLAWRIASTQTSLLFCSLNGVAVNFLWRCQSGPTAYDYHLDESVSVSGRFLTVEMLGPNTLSAAITNQPVNLCLYHNVQCGAIHLTSIRLSQSHGLERICHKLRLLGRCIASSYLAWPRPRHRRVFGESWICHGIPSQCGSNEGKV